MEGLGYIFCCGFWLVELIGYIMILAGLAFFGRSFVPERVIHAFWTPLSGPYDSPARRHDRASGMNLVVVGLAFIGFRRVIMALVY
jgi:hypothetical protein